MYKYKKQYSIINQEKNHLNKSREKGKNPIILKKNNRIIWRNMSIFEKEKIDGIALSEDRRSIRLLLTDHLDWNNEYEHLLMLQEKINSYIMFCESGQYNQIYKDSRVEYAIFEIHFLIPPSLNAMKFLEQAQKQLNELGITIECHIAQDKDGEK